MAQQFIDRLKMMGMNKTYEKNDTCMLFRTCKFLHIEQGYELNKLDVIIDGGNDL